MRPTSARPPSTGKVRRDVIGGKRAAGHRLQGEGRKIRRPDPTRIALTGVDTSLTAVGGLVEFGAFIKGLEVDSELRKRFNKLKSGRGVVYPMAAQMRLLLDVAAVGESRVFGVEALAADPLFTTLCGGSVPSIDTLYRDLERFEPVHIDGLEAMLTEHGLADVPDLKLAVAHIDIDSTVMTVFGSQEGALPGPNPRYQGRPSYHPLLARIAETGMIIGAKLRPGDTSFGAQDVEFVTEAIRNTRAKVGPNALLYVRIDGAADCTAIMSAIDEEKAFFITKADITRDLVGTIASIPPRAWKTVDEDADGRPTRQVAEVPFQRGEWAKAGKNFRVIAVRSRDRDTGKQVALWGDLDFTVQAFISNDTFSDGDDLAHRYNLRAGIEPLIGELKYGFGIGKVSSSVFFANEAAFLIKLLAFNLIRRWVRARHPQLARWRTPWLRRALIVRPGKLVRSGRRRTLRLAPRPLLVQHE